MNDKEKFYSVINQFDFLKPLWDQVNHEIRIDAFEKRLGLMSSGERHLARFMAAVWFHDNRYEFDLIAALNSLSGKYEQVILDWANMPYWP